MQSYPSIISTPKKHSVSVVFFVMAILFAVLTGLISATADPIIIFFFLAAVMGVVLMLQPTILLFFVLAGGLVFSGLAGLYIHSLRHLSWGVVLAALSLGMVAIMSRMFSKDKFNSKTSDSGEGTILAWAFIFFIITCFSTISNLGFSIDAIIGLKGYFQVWGIMLAFAWINISIPSVNRISRALLWLAALQIPFALHQHFFLVPQRLSAAAAQQFVVAPDIVVGTFVGSMEGGGGSAILTFVQLTCIILILALWRQKLVKTLPALFLAAFYFVPLLINQTNVTFFLLPIVLGLLYWDMFLKKPIRFIFGAVLLASALVGMMFIYAASPGNSGASGVGKYWDKVMSYNTGDKGYGAYVLNRTKVYPYWFKHNGFEDINGTLIGHGAGETSDGQSGLRHSTLATTRYSHMGIGLTGISGLLWEVGLLGTLALIGFLYTTYRAASRLSAKAKTGFDWAVLKTTEIGIVILGISLFHSNFILFEIGYQTFLMLVVGIVIHYSRTLQTRMESA